MSKLVLVNYRISDAQERESRRKIELMRRSLERCAGLRKELSRLEPVAGEDWAETLAKYQRLVDQNRWGEFTPDYNRLYDALPEIEHKLGQALSEARGKRTRLELTAATLMGPGAASNENAVLKSLQTGANALYADKYEEAAAQVAAIIRRRLDTPLDSNVPGLSAGQLTLAEELLRGSKSGPIELLERPTLSNAPSKDADRIHRLVAQISGLDTSLATFEDLLERLRQLPLADAAQRSLLIDSIELRAKERLDGARHKREIQILTDEGRAWLAPFQSLSADALRQRLDAVSMASDLSAVRTISAEAQEWAAAEGRRLDGARVRAALVSELQELGYEVNVQSGEWTEGTRISAARPGEPNYDVQLSAAPGGQVQSKVRAYHHAGRSKGVNRRDVEVEQSWCDDLAKLNKLLAERGIDGEILREDGPGTAAQIPLPAKNTRDMDTARPNQIERET